MRRKNWHLHICSPWSGDCAMDGVRLNIRTPWRFIYVALTPSARVERKGHWRFITVDRLR